MLYRQDEIEEWGESRGIYSASTFQAQFVKLLEEAAELLQAINAEDREAVKDAIGDCCVVIVHLFRLRPSREKTEVPTVILNDSAERSYCEFLHSIANSFMWENNGWLNISLRCLNEIADQYGFDLEACIDHVIPIINARTGRMNEHGIWVKDQ